MRRAGESAALHDDDEEREKHAVFVGNRYTSQPQERFCADGCGAFAVED